MSDNLGRTMVPISGRIEQNLYDWLVSLQYDGAKTNSDKLREALKELRNQHLGVSDAVTASAWIQQLAAPLRHSLAVLDREKGAHSEVVTLLVEHIIAMAASIISARPASTEDACQLEEQLVRRGFALTEALLRQAVTPSAAAFDPEVVRRHSGKAVELAKFINQRS